MKSIVCLANSWKSSARCVAGLEYLSDSTLGSWIRPVSNRPTHELQEDERLYAGVREPALLDVIKIPLKHHQPQEYHQENWLINTPSIWIKAGTFPASGLEPYAKTSGTLWNLNDSSQNGINDRVPYYEAKSMIYSLALIRVESLMIRMTWRTSSRGKGGQMHFTFGDNNYALRLTDPVMFDEHKRMRVPDEMELGPHYLTISLSEKFGEYCYKLVAAAIPCN